MANTTNVHRCCFKWDIYNPFTSWRNSQAVFHHGSPSVTQWKATLQLLDRGYNCWKFSLCLEFFEWFYHRYEIPADRLLVDIVLNGVPVLRKEVRPCYFLKANWYTYYLPTSVVMRPRTEPYHLAIKIEISFPGNQVGNGLFFHENDLKWLSRDLRQLFQGGTASDLTLKSNNQTEIKCHSYVIDARWNNFFKEHAFGSTVETNITYGPLKDILSYMYSGQVRINWPNFQNPEYLSELFLVIDQYKLYDLKKAFVNDLQQERVTRNNGHIESFLFQLDKIGDLRPIKNFFHPWHVNPNNELDLVFGIRVSKDNQAGPWLSYSLQSNSPSRIYAQISLEIVKRVKENDSLTAWEESLPFYEQEHTIATNETVKASPVLFLGCPETFAGLHLYSSKGAKTHYFIRFSLNVTNRTTADQVQCVHVDTLQNDLERLSVLSNDMYKLKMRKVYADMMLKSRPIVNKDVYLYRLHRGILTIRVPELHKGVDLSGYFKFPEKPPPFKQMSHKTISFVLDYIYTGKVFPIPHHLLKEVEDFARDTSCSSLGDLVRRIRLVGGNN